MKERGRKNATKGQKLWSIIYTSRSSSVFLCTATLPLHWLKKKKYNILIQRFSQSIKQSNNQSINHSFSVHSYRPSMPLSLAKSANVLLLGISAPLILALNDWLNEWIKQHVCMYVRTDDWMDDGKTAHTMKEFHPAMHERMNEGIDRSIIQ